MKTQWIIQCVGASEEDQAHLRLLLRSARKQMSEDWAWGPESEADLLMMDRQSQISDSAIQRVSRSGVAKAQLIDEDEPAPTGLFLRKPFHRDAFTALLSEVARGDIAGPVAGMAAISDQAKQENKAVAPATAQTAKAIEATVDENAMRWLLHYLPKRVLGGPARIALPGAPPLVIDPDERMFWADGFLPALEPYSREALRFGDWKRLSNDELEEVRKGSAGRPFAQLIWMDSFVHSNGSLSRRFDPEGTYRLSKRLDLSNDYPRALRISAQMTNARRLDAIARASGVDLAEVFDVVNAYEAIGYLEWTRR